MDAARDEDKPLQFGMPDLKTFGDLVREQKLTEKQERELYVTLKHLVEDVTARQQQLAKRGNRRDLVDRLKNMEQAIEALLHEIKRGKAGMPKYMPPASMQAIGEMMSNSAIEDALEEKMRPVNIKPALELHADGSLIRLADIEEFFRYQRQTAGLNHGAELLEYLLKRVHDPIAKWLEEERENEGGRPINYVRRLLLMRLATYFRKELGLEPTGTAGGPFVRFCASVFVAMGVSDEGIEKAVQAFLYPPKATPSPRGKHDV